MIEFRDLTEQDIEVRTQSVGTFQKGGKTKAYATLLLYKNARVDMAILDETVGPENWQRQHKELKGNMYCAVGINVRFRDKNVEPLWVWKEDCGTESNTEKEKGESSDSFKRACVNWGIGRELYTKIPITIFDVPYKEKNNKLQVDGAFEVEKIIVKSNQITALSLLYVKGNTKKRCFVWTADKGTQLSKVGE